MPETNLTGSRLQIFPTRDSDSSVARASSGCGPSPGGPVRDLLEKGILHKVEAQTLRIAAGTIGGAIRQQRSAEDGEDSPVLQASGTANRPDPGHVSRPHQTSIESRMGPGAAVPASLPAIPMQKVFNAIHVMYPLRESYSLMTMCILCDHRPSPIAGQVYQLNRRPCDSRRGPS